jgi:hypothetical protein
MLTGRTFSTAVKGTYGDLSKFEEECIKAPEKAVCVDFYMETKLAYAHDAIMDPCLLILKKLMWHTNNVSVIHTVIASPTDDEHHLFGRWI